MINNYSNDLNVDLENKSITNTNMAFPVAFINDKYRYFGMRNIYADWHSDMEVIIALKGDMGITINDEKIILYQGDAVLVNANILHCVMHDEYPDSEIQTIIFNPVIIYGYHGSDIERLYVLPIINGDHSFYYIKNDSDPTNWGKRFINAFTNAVKFNESKKDGYELGIKIMITDAWYLLYKNIPKSDVLGNTFSSKILLVKSSIRFIKENYMKEVSLDDIVRNSLLSKSELCKLFKKYVNESPIQYLMKHRIATACNLLSTTNKQITDIAKNVGIGDPNYFAISFRKIMGISPSEYRKKCAELNKNVSNDNNALPTIDAEIDKTPLY